MQSPKVLYCEKQVFIEMVREIFQKHTKDIWRRYVEMSGFMRRRQENGIRKER